MASRRATGYYLRQTTGGLQLVRRVEDDARFAKLTVDEHGLIQLATATDNRISSPAAMRRNFTASAGRAPQTGFQLHHLIPDNVVRNHPLMREALKRGLFDLDRAENLLELPGAARAEMPGVHGYLGSHPRYDRLVWRELDSAQQSLRRAHPNGVPDDALSAKLREVENDLRDMILSRDPAVPTRIDPETGTKVLAAAPTSTPGDVA